MKKTDLFGQKYIATEVAIGDKLPATVGLSDTEGRPTSEPGTLLLDMGMIPMLSKLEQTYKKYEESGRIKIWEKYIQNAKLDVSPKTILACEVFRSLLSHDFNGLTATEDGEDTLGRRNQRYIGDHICRPFGDLVKEKEMACLEYAALAQCFFQRLGIDSQIFMGDRFDQGKDKNPEEYGEEHTFLILKDGKKHYVFDQMLSHIEKGFEFPALRQIPLSEANWQKYLSSVSPKYEGGKAGVFPAVNIFSKGVKYYGCSSVIGKITPQDVWTDNRILEVSKTKQQSTR